MNVLIHIDQSWSYQFFEFNKNYLSTQDFFKFTDEFYRSAGEYLLAQANFQHGLSREDYGIITDRAFRICDAYPEIGRQLQFALTTLHNSLRPALGALPGLVHNLTTVTNTDGLLIGIVCETR